MKVKVRFLCALAVLILAASCATASDVNNIKGDFMSLYNSEWKLYNFNYRLFTIIDRDFDTYISSMSPGTSSFQLAINYNNVVEEIFSSVLRKFHSGYILFLKSFQNDFYKILQENPGKFPIDHSKGSLAFSDIISLYYRGEQKMLESVWHNLNQRIKDRLSTPYVSFALLLLGVVIFIFRGFLAGILSRKEENSKRTKLILSVAGTACFIFGVVMVSRGLFFTKGVVREFFNEQTKNFYTEELPELYWGVIEQAINEGQKINS